MPGVRDDPTLAAAAINRHVRVCSKLELSQLNDDVTKVDVGPQKPNKLLNFISIESAELYLPGRVLCLYDEPRELPIFVTFSVECSDQ